MAGVVILAVLHILGLETGDTTEFTSINSGTIDDTIKRSGNHSLKDGSSAKKDFAAQDNAVTRLGFRFGSAPGSSLEFATYNAIGAAAGGQARYFLETDRTVSAQADGDTKQTGSTQLGLDTWHLIEVRYAKGTGSDAVAEIKVNGSVEATSSSGTGTDQVDQINLETFAASPAYLDDVRIDSGSTYPGDGKIEALRPNADSSDSGEDEFTASGTEPSWDEVDDDPLDDTSFADSSSGAGEVDQLWEQTTIASVGTINHVRVGVRAQRQNGAGRTHHIRWKNAGGTAENSADLGLGTAFAYFIYDPTDQPASQSDLDGCQAGGAVDASGGRVMELSECYVMVDYTPGAPTTAIQDIIGRGVVPFPR